VLQGVLFAYRSVPHTSTKYSPFFVLYQREPVLPVDLKYSLNEDGSIIDENVFTGEFNEDQFEETLQCMLSMRGTSFYIILFHYNFINILILNRHI